MGILIRRRLLAYDFQPRLPADRHRMLVERASGSKHSVRGVEFYPDTLLYISVVFPTNVLWLGAQANAVMARWTAPYAGNYSIIGSFQANDTYESKVNVGILKDGSTFLLTDSFSSFGNAKNFALSNIPLAAGTTIDFELAYTDTANSDNASLVASIDLLKPEFRS
jgi:hypothetical protein